MAQSDDLLILENARVFDPGARLDLQADVVVSAGAIVEIAPGAAKRVTSAHARHWDAAGRWLLPSFTELGAELGEPGQEYREDLESGLGAAARGGFTRVCCSPETDPPLDNPALVEWLVNKAQTVSAVELLPIAAATLQLQGQGLSEMAALAKAGAGAVGTGTRSIESAEVLRRVLEYARDTGITLFHHPEEHSLTRGSEMNEGEVATRLGLRGSPAVAEAIALGRDLLLAETTGARLHVSRISTRGSAQLLERARERGLPVTAAVPISHLILTEQALSGYDTHLRLVPPLRSEEDRLGMCRALEAGVISAVTSAHTPRIESQKDCDFSSAAPGAVGLATCFSLLLRLVDQGELSLSRAVESLTSGPAEALQRPCSRLEVGQVAHLVLLDPNATWQVTRETLGGKCQNSPFLGETLKGRIDLTLSAGRIAFERDALPRP